MEIRHTTSEDMDTVMAIYDNARLFMRKNGNLKQWDSGYPGLELIKNDVLSGNSYVCMDSDCPDSTQIAGVFTFIQGSEPTYFKIVGGTWLNDEPYGVVHRIASVSRGKGVAAYCLNWCLEQCKNIRIDTHWDNKAMQNLLAKLDFIQCGIIYLADGSERLAYQKKIP